MLLKLLETKNVSGHTLTFRNQTSLDVHPKLSVNDSVEQLRRLSRRRREKRRWSSIGIFLAYEKIDSQNMTSQSQLTSNFYEIDRTCVALESSSCCSRRNRLSRSIESIAAELLRYSRASVLASELGRVV